MSLSDLPLMKAMGAKMKYLNQREGVLAQNIANADTPGYQSRDLKKIDFGAILNLENGRMKSISMAKTSSGHVSSGFDADTPSKDIGDKMVYEVSADRNGVILEEQMVKASQVKMDYSMLLNLMSKQSAMYKTALGTRS